MGAGMPRLSDRAALHAAVRERDAVAALEFALIAPIMAIMIMAVYDASRALIVWQQVENAAQAVAAAAEKLSVSQSVTTTSLTGTQMQNAMTSVYAEIPGLSSGITNPNPVQVSTGAYSVTLSEIVYYPTCKASNPQTVAAAAGCSNGQSVSASNPQVPYMAWTTWLNEPGATATTGRLGAYGTPNTASACLPLQQVYPTWNTTENGKPPVTRLEQMVDPADNATYAITLTPQIVADVSYTFKPTFAQVLPLGTTIIFTATAMLSTPFGDNTQQITYNSTSATSGTVYTCPPPT
jgi:Flp pilus assembly protein TadG